MKNQSCSSTHLDPCTRLRLTQSVKTLLKLAVEIDRFSLKAKSFLKRNHAMARHDRAAQTSETDGKSKPESHACAVTEAEQQLEFERVYRWNALIKDAQHTRRIIRKSVTTTKAIARELKSAEIDLASPDWRAKFADFRKSEWKQGALFAELTKRGVNAEVLKATMQFMLKEDECPDIQRLLNDLVKLSDNFSTRINNYMLTAGSDDEQDEALTSTSVSGLTVEILVPCASLPAPLNANCVGIAIIGFALVGAFIAVGEFIEDLFNATDDDNARSVIERSTCDQLRAMPLQAKLDLITPILSGPTGNDDERAILKLLDCVSCAQVTEIVNAVGLPDLMDEFNGEEWDRLVIRLRECGLIGFSDWDDDATREFINSNDCATLNAFNVGDIRLLLRNLLEGATLDEDEDAIIKLIRCLPCNKLQNLIRLPGVKFDDFDDAVQGDQWDTLERLFARCGIRED